MRGNGSTAKARAYLQDAHLYRLGVLPTEQPHPLTHQLSLWARSDLPRAVSVLKRIDIAALNSLIPRAAEIDIMARRIRDTLAAGKRIYLCGCGATGRLSLSLEFLWRRQHAGCDQVRSFMAGGDVALVHALEGFEDHPGYGARHLQEMGFADGDLLISCTEGGETPYVIGATEQAAAMSTNKPFFLYCNRDDLLAPNIQRFRRVHENPDIEKICLDVGPMALSGSTRMQASTVLQLAVGAALLHGDEPAADLVTGFASRVRETEFSFLPDYIQAEAGIYAGGNHVTYRVKDYGITVLTDTTERAPTFSLIPFDQLRERQEGYSLCYVALDEATNHQDAWQQLLQHAPRPLNWPEVDSRTSSHHLYGFDFSVHAVSRRRQQISDREHHDFAISRNRDGIDLSLGRLAHQIPVDGLGELLEHLLLKQVLNIHSTLVMGRLGRYQNNIMTWVSPTNGKLIDRATRYVQHLLASAGHRDPGYDRIIHELFAEMDESPPGESVVLRTYRALSRRQQAG